MSLCEPWSLHKPSPSFTKQKMWNLVNPLWSLKFHTETLWINYLCVGETCEGYFHTFFFSFSKINSLPLSMSRWRASFARDLGTTFWEIKPRAFKRYYPCVKIWTIFNCSRVVGNKRLPLVVYMCTAHVVPIRYKRGACCLIWLLGSPEPSPKIRPNTHPRFLCITN